MKLIILLIQFIFIIQIQAYEWFEYNNVIQYGNKPSDATNGEWSYSDTVENNNEFFTETYAFQSQCCTSDIKEFDFITQTIKMGSNLISAIPKSILGVALIPIIMDLFS